MKTLLPVTNYHFQLGKKTMKPKAAFILQETRNDNKNLKHTNLRIYRNIIYMTKNKQKEQSFRNLFLRKKTNQTKKRN